MKKGVIAIFVSVLLISAGAFAETVTDGAISQEVTDYVKTFVEKGGIADEDIKEVKKLDQDDLPDEVEIKEINENKIGIYEVGYQEEPEEPVKKVFVVTYATNEFKKKSEFKNIQNLDFGYAGEALSSVCLKTATGVDSCESGYVMMHEGSITGISTSLTISSGAGKLQIKVYKNGEDTGFENVISSDDLNKIDYDLQSENVVTYQPGDIISVYVEQTGQLNYSNVVTIVETTS